MEIIVQKFGGTSVADLERIRHVASIVKTELDSGKQVIAVVSAMAGVTNSLITKCAEISRLDEANSLQEYDAAIASGEIITSALLALQLQSMGIKAKSLQGWQVPIQTDYTHGNAQVVSANQGKIMELLNRGVTPIITGFQGISAAGDITTLGKGGSDTTAAIIAASVNAKSCDIYTDVDGVYTADPRVVHNAKKIDIINIDELYVLCCSGAKVLHPRAALAAKRYGFKLRILSSFTINEGTTTQTQISNMENRQITAITSNKNLLKIEIEHNTNGFASIVHSFAQEFVSIEQTFSFGKNSSIILASLSDKNKCEKLLSNLKNNKILAKYSIEANISSVTIVGYGIKNDGRFIWEVIKLLNDSNVSVLSTDISDIKMSMIVNDCDNEKVIKLLHEYCF